MHKTVVVALAVGAVAGAEAASYAIDPTHTFVTFEVPRFATSTTRGRFDRKEGTVQFDRAARTGRVEITIDMTSVSTGTDAFDKHLRGKDFFDAARHPTARFVGERFVFDGDRVVAVDGALTLLGKTQPVTLQAQRFNCYPHPMFRREVCGGDFETTIARSRWGMSWGLESGAADEVRLLVQVEAIKQ